MSDRKDPTGIRAQRIQGIHAAIREVGEMKLTMFLARCEYDMGLTRTRARVYLRTLEDLGYVHVDEENDLIREVPNEG